MSNPETTATWQPIEGAPDDGRYFLALCPGTLIAAHRPARAVPDLRMIRRVRSSPDSQGYWQSIWGHSVAEGMIAGALWAELDALPLREMYQRIEERRISQGGEPLPLPEPFGMTDTPLHQTALRPGFLHRGDLGMQRSRIAPLLTGEELAELFALADFCIGAGGSLHFCKVSPMAKRLKELRLIEWVREPEKHSGRLHRLTKLGWLTLLTRAEAEMHHLLPMEEVADACC